MKIVLLFVIGIWGGGCATSAQQFAGGSATLADLKQTCVAERRMQISREWSRYEFERRVQVMFPDWRRSARKWARYECEYGRPIENFHPWHLMR